MRVTGAFELSWLHEVADNAAIVFATSPCPDGTASSELRIGRTMVVVTTVSTSFTSDLHLTHPLSLSNCVKVGFAVLVVILSPNL